MKEKVPPKVIVVLGEDDITWAPVAPELINHLKDAYTELTIVDASDFSMPRFRRPPNWVMKRYSLSSGNSLIDASIPVLRFLTSRARYPEIAINPNDMELLSESVESLLMSIFADYKPQRHFVLGPIMRSATLAKATELYIRALGCFEQIENLILFIPNGRFPYQKAFELAGRRSGAVINFYERGFRPQEGFFLGGHQTTDRVAWQKKAEELSRALLPQTSLDQAELWVRERRRPNSGINEFALSWERRQSKGLPIRGFSTVFFTSSQDEFLGLSQWKGFGWKDQYEAFEAFATNVPGPKCLRIHPNFINKSFGHALDEVRRIFWLFHKTPDLFIVWPNDPVSTYDLIDQSERVFVHGSTVGVEASAFAKPVWNSGNAVYDIHADIRNFFPNTAYESSFFEPWEVDPKPTLEIVQAHLNSDIPFDFGVMPSLWNSATIPVTVRLLNLFLVGSLSYFSILVGRSLSIRANRILALVAKSLTRSSEVSR